MNRQFMKDSLGWGLGLWAIGYFLGFLFFAILPVSMIGWAIMPIGAAIALWVAFKRVNGDSLGYYMKIAVIWTLIAIVFDYIFLVKLLKPADGYYKLDVYIYYIFTFAIPFIAGLRKIRKTA